MLLTGFYTGTEDRPVQDVGRTSLTGAATVVLSGISLGLESAVFTAVVIALVLYAAFLLGGAGVVGLFAIALAGCGLLTTVGVIVAMDTFGPVSDNAQGIAEMSGEVGVKGCADPHRARRGRQHDQGHHQGHRDRDRSARGDRPVRLVHRRCRRRAQGHVRAVRHRLGRVLPADAGRPDRRRLGRVPVLGAGDLGRGSGGRSRRVRGAAPVRGDPRDHGRHRHARVRQGRRHLHEGLAAGARDAGTAGCDGADRGRLRARAPRRWPGTWPAPSPAAR